MSKQASKVEVTGTTKNGVSAEVTYTDGSQETVEIHGNNKSEVEGMINAEYGDASVNWGGGSTGDGGGSTGDGGGSGGLWSWLKSLFVQEEK